MTAWWQGLASRERALVALAGWCVAAALIWVLAVEPFERRLVAADSQLAAGRALHEELRAQAAEAALLRAALPAADPSGQPPREGLEQALAGSGFDEAVLEVEELEEGLVRLQAERLPFDAFVLWLDGVERELDLSVQRLSLRAHAEAGHVDGEVTLAARAAAP